MTDFLKSFFPPRKRTLFVSYAFKDEHDMTGTGSGVYHITGDCRLTEDLLEQVLDIIRTRNGFPQVHIIAINWLEKS